MGIAAYWTLLAAWLPFLAPALRAPGAARRWSRAAVGLGLAGVGYEAWMSLVWAPTTIAPIRLDIFLVSIALVAVYGSVALRLWRAGWARTAALAGGLTLAAGVGMAGAWVQAGREAARHQVLRQRAHAMLFAAKFRDREAYARSFGMTGEPRPGLPVGHWEVEAGSPSRWTRLVVGPEGRAFLFYRCGPTECQLGPGARLRPRGGPAAAATTGWEAHLAERGVGGRRLVLESPQESVLSARVDGVEVRLRRTSPPLLGDPPRERLADLGAWSAVRPVRQHVRVSQLWLWRDHDGAPLAVGIFRTLLPGRRAEFVTPHALGRGQREGGEGGAWRFRWREHGRTREARVWLAGAEVVVELPGEEGWSRHTLSRQPVFRDEVIELAPRTTAHDWNRWMQIQLASHFSAADIPAP